MEPLYSISESEQEGLVRLALAGEIDLAATSAVREHVVSALKADSAGIVIDLAAVTFLDSSGIGVLLESRRLTIEAGRAFQAVNPQGSVASVLDLTGVRAYLAGDAAVDPA